MHRACKLLLMALLSTATAALPQAALAGDDSAEKAVAALEQQWMESQRTNNPALIASVWAETIVSTGSDGKVLDKAGMLAAAKATKYTSVDYDDIKVTAYGNTAIATGGFTGKGTDSSGKPMDSRERWTDTWVKMPDGKWQCVATHSSTLAK